MTLKVTLTKTAKRNLDSILRYVADESPPTARRLLIRFSMLFAMLSENPKAGPVGRKADTRELVITRTPYIAIYRIKGRRIDIVRVLHGRQKWP